MRGHRTLVPGQAVELEYGYGKINQFGLPMVEQVTLDGETAHVENDPVTGQPLMLRSSGGTQMLYVYDGIGNPEAIATNLDTVATAYDYDPYGVPTLTKDSGGQATDINPYQFKGGIHDRTTNWVKFGHRWYSVGTGRFTQRDTLDAPLDPANANRYAFAANDPINNSDPLGLIVAQAKFGACAIICANVTVGKDDNGKVGLQGGVGIGPRIGPDIGVGVAGGDYSEEKKPGVELSCGAGPVSGSVNISNDERPTVGGMFGLPSQGCSGEATLSGTL